MLVHHPSEFHFALSRSGHHRFLHHPSWQNQHDYPEFATDLLATDLVHTHGTAEEHHEASRKHGQLSAMYSNDTNSSGERGGAYGLLAELAVEWID